MDLGACPKSHTERLKTEFLAAREANPSDPIFSRFQMEYESNIFAFVDECDRRIRAAHRRLEKTPEENAKTTNLMREIAEIELAIQGGTEKIETLGMYIPFGNLPAFLHSLGEQGKVDESMREMAAIEALKSEKSEKEVCYALDLFVPWEQNLISLNLARASATHRYVRSVRPSETSGV
jgi:hypothetical protein